MKFSTPVDLPPRGIQVTPRSRVLLIGSCFTEHIGRHLNDSLPPSQVCINPSGILYNPGSICTTLEQLTSSNYHFSEQLAFPASDGLWHHWHYSTLFSAPTLEALRERLTQAWESSQQVLAHPDLLLITFSTDHAYLLKEGENRGTLVANCHKQPGRLFDETVLKPEALQKRWDKLLSRLHEQHPALEVVFTLSPYRYYKYGLHENALSKARLLLLTDYLCRNHPHTHYFPAYEIITDELRDYRFYAPDMLHPTDQAADYVWERFCDWSFDEEMRQYARERQALIRDLNHRPLNPESPDFIKFRQKTEERRRQFEDKWHEKWT